MVKRRRVVLGSIVGLLVAGIVFINVWIAPTGTGYYAKIMCSGVFVAGLDPERVVDEDLRPYWYLGATVDREAETVTSTMFGMAPRAAVYRDELGCTLAIDVSVEQLREQAPSFDPRPVLADQPWPVGDAVTGEPVAGVDYERLEAALDYAFVEADPERPVLTRAVVVSYGDELVGERYADGISRFTPLLGWSMTKSVGATLIGILVNEGALDVRAPAPVPQWQGADDPRAEVTLDQLLRMSSGLEFNEVYGPFADATDMLFESHSTSEMARSKPLVHEPDTVWSYSSGTSNLVAWIARQTVERDADWATYASFPRRALFDPIGMNTAVLEPDPSGTFVASSFMYASARDWARFGLLHLHDGVWGDQRILPEGWVEYVSTPTPGAPMGDYGAQWWTNVGKSDDPSERRFPSAPTDVFQASGYQGQAVVVIPSRDAVIVRLGMTHQSGAFDLDGFIARVLEALPEPAEPGQ